MDIHNLINITILFLWSLFVVRYANKKGFFNFPHIKGTGLRLTMISVLTAFTIFLGVQIAFEYFFPYCKWKDPISIILTALALWSFMELLPTVKKIVWGSQTFVSSRHSLYNLGFGAMTWLICYPIVMLFNQLVSLTIIFINGNEPIDQMAVELMKGYLDNPRYFWVMALIICVVIPVIEEIVFRGFLQTKLKSWMKLPYAIALTSIIFSLCHFVPEQGIQNISILSALFVLSGFLGYIYERQQSLFAPIGLHCTFNTFSVMLIFFQQ
jgi:membrane protease YdiL (CAAX protease family)